MKPRFKLMLDGRRVPIGMHFEDIKAALRMRGLALHDIAALAASDGDPCSVSAVSRVLRGTLKSGRIARIVSAHVGVPVEQLWPGTYITVRPV